MEITKAEFKTSVGSNNFPEGLTEIAVVGRSNVGKSSLINFLTNHGKLARTSKEPGRTRLINYFSINDGQFYLVDLPGYGYARVSDAEKEKWATLIESYLLESTGLKHVFVLVDIRHDPTVLDKQMINYLYHYNVPFSIIATKADKLSRAETARQRKAIADALHLTPSNIYVSSSLNKSGKAEIMARIEQVLNN